MNFTVNQALLSKARGILHGRKDIHWIVGGSCAGKSTVCRTISTMIGIPTYDMDQFVFDRYMNKYRQDRHPVSLAWFSAANPLAWSLSLSEGEFEAMYRAANAEYLDLLADDLEKPEFEGPVLIDGGITHPSILVETLSPDNVVCIDTADETRVKAWEGSQERSTMKEWIDALPQPEQMWQKFLAFDDLLARTIVAESREEEIKIFFRDDATTIEELTELIVTYFRI